MSTFPSGKYDHSIGVALMEMRKNPDPSEIASCGCCYIVTKAIFDLIISEIALRVGAMELISSLAKGTEPSGPGLTKDESILFVLNDCENKIKEKIHKKTKELLIKDILGGVMNKGNTPDNNPFNDLMKESPRDKLMSLLGKILDERSRKEGGFSGGGL